MGFLNLSLNILWLVMGGFEMGIGWLVASGLMALTLVGLPWARGAFNIALLIFLPFGSKSLSRSRISGRTDLGTGPLGWLGNLIWILLAGWWLFLGHLVLAVLCGITVIGIPFTLQHWKIAKMCFAPIGRSIVFGPPFR